MFVYLGQPAIAWEDIVFTVRWVFDHHVSQEPAVRNAVSSESTAVTVPWEESTVVVPDFNLSKRSQADRFNVEHIRVVAFKLVSVCLRLGELALPSVTVLAINDDVDSSVSSTATLITSPDRHLV